MLQARNIPAAAALACAACLLLGPAAAPAAAQDEDLEELGDAAGKRGEVLKEYGKVLRDRLKGKDFDDELEEAREARADLAEGRDPFAGTGRSASGLVEPIDVQRLLQAPDAWIGRTVRLEGEVQDVLSSRAFTLRTGLVGPGSDLLVLSAAPLPGLSVEGGRWQLEDEDVVLTGRMQLARPAQLERELGWDLAPDLEAVIDGKLVLVAGTVVED